MSASRLSCPTRSQTRRFGTLSRIVSRADDMALDFFARRSELAREVKSRADFVTEADRSVEDCIRRAIAELHPGDSVVGEELGGEQASSYWLVDPIDGTSNFLSGLPLWAISIAYIEDGHPIFGAVSMPLLNRCLIGGAAFPIQEIGAKRTNAGNGSLVFGIGRNDHWDTSRRDMIESTVAPAGLTGVSLGSCATSLALVASGELAGYAEGHVGFWDIAAGVALCEAAQVPVSFLASDASAGSFVAAGPAALQPRIFSATVTVAAEPHDC